MKLKMTSTQFKNILEKDLKPKYPITMDLSKITKSEVEEIVRLLKQKRK